MKKHQFLLLTCLFWVLGFTAWSGASGLVYPKDLDGADFTIRIWNMGDGLPQNSVLSLCQSRAGFIWLGTEAGAVCFDGALFRTFNTWNTPELKNDRILCLFEDIGGKMWLGTEDGGLVMIKQGERLRFSLKEGQVGAQVQALAEDYDRRLWVGTSQGLYVESEYGFTRKDLGVVDENCNVLAVFRLPTGKMLCLVDRNTVVVSGKNTSSQIVNTSQILSGHINTLLPSRTGRLWLGTDMGLYYVDEDKAVLFNDNSGFSPETIHCLLEDSRGRLWVGTDGNGLYFLSNRRFVNIIEGEALTNDFVFCLLEDKEANIWAGTYTSGLLKFTRKKIASINRENGLPDLNVRAITRDHKGNLWVGTNKRGVCRFVNDRLVDEYNTENGLSDNQVLSLLVDSANVLWIGTHQGGINRLTDQGISALSRKEDWAGNPINVLFQDSQSRIWVGTDREVIILDRTGHNLGKPGEYLHGAYIRTFLEDSQGKIWVGTRNGMYIFYQGHFERVQKINHDVLTICEDSANRIWLGTGGAGLYCIDGARQLRFTEKNGMPDNYIFSIHEDAQKNFWLGSYQGIINISKPSIAAICNGQKDSIMPVVYDESDGMESRECTRGGHSWFQDEGKGILYYPTRKGVAVVNLNVLKTNQYVPPVYIGEVLADNRSILGRKNPLLPSHLKIVEIYYQCLSYQNSTKIRFRYKLDGYDKEWIDSHEGQRRRVMYINLKPGQYRFRVIAANNDGLWNKTGASYSFRIQHKFLRSTVFYVLIFVGLAGAFAGAFYLRYKLGGSPQRVKYSTSSLTDDQASRVTLELRKMMEADEVYLDPDLTLKKLAAKLSIHSNHLSRIINEQYDAGYNDFINKYRIEAAKKKLEDPIISGKTILEIAYECGFFSKSVFNTAFKKFTGETPSNYRKLKGNS